MPRTATDTHAAVLAAALEVFARAGVQAARLEDVAAAAGVTRATLYYHFHGKDDLIAALVDRAISQLAREVAAAQTGPVRDLVTVQLRVYAADRDLYRLLLTELWGSVDPREMFDRIEGEVLAPVTACIERAIAAGEIRAIDSRIAALAVYGQTAAVALGHILNDEPFDLDALDAEVGALVAAALRPIG